MSARTRTTESSVIVEIGGEWLKIAQLTPADGGVGAAIVHVEALPHAAAVADIAPALKRAFHKLKLSTRHVVSFLPRQVVNLRLLELPSTKADELDGMMELQLTQQTPYSPDEVMMDYCVLGPSRPGFTRVMLAIVQRSELRYRYAAFQEAGIDLERMTISSEGMIQWLQEAIPAAGATLVIDMDATATELCVAAKGQIVFTRTLLMGAHQLREDKAGWRVRFVREVRSSLEMSRGELGDVVPSRVCLTGAVLPGLAAELTDGLGLPVEERSSLKQVKSWTPGRDKPAEADLAAVSLTALIGTGMAAGGLSINMVPDTVSDRRKLEAAARSMTIFVVLAATVLVALSALMVLHLGIPRSRLSFVTQQCENSARSARQVENMRQIIRAVAVRVSSKHSPVEVLQAIHGSIGEGAYIDNVDVDLVKGTVTLGGLAETLKHVNTLVQTLEQTPALKNVQESTPAKMDNNGRFRFQLSAEIGE